MLHKSALKPEHMLLSFKDHIGSVKGSSIHAEPAVVLYLSIVDMHADTIEAMSDVGSCNTVQRVYSQHSRPTLSNNW